MFMGPPAGNAPLPQPGSMGYQPMPPPVNFPMYSPPPMAGIPMDNDLNIPNPGG
jgi:hypothetical protein